MQVLPVHLIEGQAFLCTSPWEQVREIKSSGLYVKSSRLLSE